MLREACRQARAWRAAGHGADGGVNVSPAQLRHPDVLQTVDEALRASGLRPALLELEITEGLLVEATERGARAAWRGWRRAGCSWRSTISARAKLSLAYLRRLPAQRIKIDRSFVRDIGSDAEDEAVVRAIVTLGHSLGKQVVAEGVETRGAAGLPARAAAATRRKAICLPRRWRRRCLRVCWRLRVVRPGSSGSMPARPGGGSRAAALACSAYPAPASFTTCGSGVPVQLYW